MADAAREAARLRTHREAFELSIARGITLEAARRELVQALWIEADRRLAARRLCGTAAPASAPLTDPDFQPWMMRD